MKIGFAPVDISEEDIAEVIDTLKSGWITTGPKTKEFERQIAAFCGTKRAVCLNSATAAMELALRLFGIGPGDEVITSAFTYSASASVIHHVGAKIVLCDITEDEPKLDLDHLQSLINKNTKAVIPVDIAGVIENLDDIRTLLESKKDLFQAKGKYQKALGRVLLLSDAAHSFGAKQKNRISGAIADFSSFSFHAVKNLTTAEGGALTWQSLPAIEDEEIYTELMLLALHGQSKDALAKSQPGMWEYDIVFPGYKCNMTDINASLGLSQLRRYSDILNRRKALVERYEEGLKDSDVICLNHQGEDFESCRHLFLIRIPGIDEVERNSVITKLALAGISANVHFKPLPLFTAYRDLGFTIDYFPNAYGYYRNLITLPLFAKMTFEEVDYITNTLKNILK